MNRPRMLFLTVLLLGLLQGSLWADTSPDIGSESNQPVHHYSLDENDRQHVKPVPDPVNAERRTQQKLRDLLTGKMKLTDEQFAAIATAFDEQGTRIDTALREFMDRVKGIEDDKDQKILAVLRDDQKKKYPDMKDEAQKEAEAVTDSGSGQREGHHHHGGGMGGS